MPEFITRLTEKWQKIAHQFPYLPRAISLVWRAAPRLTMAWLTMVLVLGLLPAFTVWFSKPLVNSITEAMASHGDPEAVMKVVSYALLMAGLILTGELLRAVGNWIRTAQAELVGAYISGLIHQQSVAVDMAFYDLPAYFDHLHRARYEAGHRPLALLESLGGMLRNGITLVSLAILLIPYAWWLPLVLVGGTLPALYVVLDHTLKQHVWRLKATADERRTWYFDWLLTSRETAAELRLFNLGSLLQNAYQALRTRLREQRLKLIRNEAVAGLVAGTAGLVAAGAAMAWMGWRALQGHATLGDLALFFQAFSRGQGLMRTLLEDLGRIYGNSLFLGDLFQFLELKPRVVDPSAKTILPISSTKGAIRFENVWFHYPVSQRPILKGLNMTVEPGQIVAIVGANGAGKSTMMKLLFRFYDPVEGRITLDGTDLRQFSLADLRTRVTAMFQEPVNYSATVAENIALSPHAEQDAPMQAAAQAAGADKVIEHLPDGYQTLLGIWFKGGTDLSVGEWQRLALARAFLRPAPVLVLDEPTSAMDPWAESQWLRTLRKATCGRTVLLITHRLTTAMTADVIYVMESGRVVESGTHAELIVSGGAYADSWQTCRIKGDG